uniref:SH3 domain-containing kinase-binding protein 1 n=1 Tax=Caenorhabditis tropicalis TaxID=1561998 RepID=A0A1I7TKH1_9PELO
MASPVPPTQQEAGLKIAAVEVPSNESLERRTRDEFHQDLLSLHTSRRPNRVKEMAQVESEVVAGNVRDIVNRLSRDMTNRNPFSVHQQAEKRALPNVSTQPQPQLFIATYAYNSKQEDELSFVVGDIIELITEVEDGWSKGKLKSTGHVGMFPTNFVTPKPAPSTPTSVTTSTTASSSGSRPKTGNSEVVMRAEPKAIDRTPSTILSEQSSSLKTLETKPSSASFSIPAASASTDTSSSETTKTKEMARVKFVYNPQHDDELALKDIDMLLNITNKNCGDAGWFEGELNGKKGLFPDNFVELVQVPLGTESGAKYASVSRQATLNFVTNKPPPVNPPQPAVPPKPAKVVPNDSIPLSSTTTTSSQALNNSVPTPHSNNMPVGSSSSTGVKTNFAALREKMSNHLKVVAPEKVASVQQKPSEQRDRSSTTESANGDFLIDNDGGGDQVTELQHITKNRARPPKSRPMSMVMHHRSSDESPPGRLSSPTSASSVNTMSSSMFVPPAAKDISIPSIATSSPFKASAATPSTIAPPSSASKPALRPVASNSLVDSNDSSSIRKLASPDRQKSPELVSSSDYVSRAEYDALLDRFRALESRVLALEKNRF